LIYQTYWQQWCAHIPAKNRQRESNLSTELICQSQNKYTHILWNNPKWWPRKCSDTMKLFRLAPFLPNEIFCQIVPTPKDSLEGGKNNIRAKRDILDYRIWGSGASEMPLSSKQAWVLISIWFLCKMFETGRLSQ